MYEVKIEFDPDEDNVLALKVETGQQAKSLCKVLKANAIVYSVLRVSEPVKVEF